jgi:hypothetical protein
MYAYIGGVVEDLVDSSNIGEAFGLHMVDTRGVPHAFKDFVIEASDGSGNALDVNLDVRGNIKTSGQTTLSYLGVGDITTINTDYRFQVSGNSLIDGILSVKALRFIGAESPEGNQDIITPVNISVIGVNVTDTTGNHEAFSNNSIILREKKFTSDSRIDLNNNLWLDSQNSGKTGTQYYTIYIANSTPVSARWARDNVAFMQTQFNHIVEANPSSNSVLVNSIPDTWAAYRRYACERVTLCTLGQITAVWNGFISDPVGARNLEITSYKFSSSYFRNSAGGQDIEWLPGATRFGQDNFAVHIEGSMVDAETGLPNILTINKTFGIYVPFTSWWYAKVSEQSLYDGYNSVVLYQPYETVEPGLDEFSIATIYKQYPSTNPPTDSGWRLALYPRLYQQNRQSTGVGHEQQFTGIWNLDLIMLPENVGVEANLVGKMYISYVQS